jgi:predicted carbohydrate-binding protein with CBM5 and CBM33 domain
MINKTCKILFGSLLLATISQAVFAHGIMLNSRTYYCGFITKADQIVWNIEQAMYPQCKEVLTLPDGSANNLTYNFMQVVSHTYGKKAVGTIGSQSRDAQDNYLPSNVCGFDSEGFDSSNPNKGRGKTPWDKSISNWPTVNMASNAVNTIIWDIQWGNHYSDTKEFVYYITKPNFVYEAGKELTWDDFEAQPFCDLQYDPSNPNANSNITLSADKNSFATKCHIPARSGHQVIYGEWGRTAPTYERFHGCIDAVFDGSGIPPTETIPDTGNGDNGQGDHSDHGNHNDHEETPSEDTPSGDNPSDGHNQEETPSGEDSHPADGASNAPAPAPVTSGGGCSAITDGNDFGLVILLAGSALYAYRRRKLKVKNPAK